MKTSRARQNHLQHLDKLSEQIKEREREETRQEIDELSNGSRRPDQNDDGAWRSST
jgi:hypothetical protein